MVEVENALDRTIAYLAGQPAGSAGSSSLTNALMSAREAARTVAGYLSGEPADGIRAANRAAPPRGPGRLRAPMMAHGDPGE
jgi:hypothetical protein